MKRKTVLIVCFISAAIFSSSMVGYIFGTSVAKRDTIPYDLTQVKQSPTAKADPAAVIEQQKNRNSDTSFHCTYVLREDNGKISLFIKDSNGKETIHSSYDVPIAFLPESDRKSLQKGIEFDSLDEIMSFVEDYVG